MIEQLNHLARLWWDWSAAMFWQVGLLIVLIGCIDLLIRRWAWPQLRYALWSLILIKLLLPPTLSLPSGVVPELRPVIRQALQRLEYDRSVVSDASIAVYDSPPLISDSPDDGDPRLGTPADRRGGPSVQLAAVGRQVAEPSSSVQVTWQVYAMLVWVAGTLILGIWLVLRLHSLCGRQGYQAAAASLPQSFYNQLAGCAGRLGLRHIPGVIVTKRLTSPAVFGVLRPVLLMPKGYLRQLSRKDTEHMLLHELAHIKRGDLVIHSLYMLLQIGYWYNPLLWLVRRQIHHLRELSCDATVANLLRERTVAYRQTLLETARRLLATSVEPGLGLLGLFEDSNRLLVRLNWLTKPTWRYRTMKRAVVVITAALMFACVLPMAQGQESASNREEAVTAERDEQLSQQMAQLERQLQQLMEQQKDLQNQLRALARQRDQMLAKDKQKPGKPPVVVTVPRQSARSGEDVDARIEREIEQRMEREIEERVTREVMLAHEGARRATKEEALARREARAAGEAEKAHGERMQQWGDQMRAWGDQMRQWQNSDEMNHWKEQMERWAQEQVGQHQGAEGAHVSPPGPMPAMPPMPTMPSMGEMPAPVVVPTPHVPATPHVVVPHPGPAAPLPPTAPAPADVQGRVPQIAAPAVPHVPSHDSLPDLPDGNRVVNLMVPERVKLVELLDLVGKYTDMNFVYNPEDVTGEVALRVQGGREGAIRVSDLYRALESALKSQNLAMVRRGGNVVTIVPAPGNTQDTGQIVPCGEYVVKSFPTGAVLQVDNAIGSITIEGTEDRDCTVTATARIHRADKEEAERIAQEIKMHVTPMDDRVEVRAEIPDDMSEEQRKGIGIDLHIVVPDEARVKASQKVGGIRLSSLMGDVKAATDVGSIKARQLRGDVALRTNVGNIDFVAATDVSAKIQARANVGSVSSDLPLEITQAAMMHGSNRQGALGGSARGVLGSGDKKIDLSANVGSIRIRKASAEPF